MGEPAFKIGDRVFLASAGLGRIADYAGRGPDGKPAPLGPGVPPDFYVVEVGQTVALVPLSRAETLRAPLSKAEAAALLDALRASEPLPPPLEALLERGKRIVHSGTPLEHARLLRELCELPVPLSDALASSVGFLSRLVLPELADVLGLKVAQLEAELSRRYPAFASIARGP
jgi:RNA polymerase-interacting CarD/CdnL/TRCF family regulator